MASKKKNSKALKKKLSRNRSYQQLDFIDACIFLEIILGLPGKNACLDLLGKLKGKARRSIVSNYVLGEVIVNIYKIDENFPQTNTEEAMHVLDYLISSFKVIIGRIEKKDVVLAQKIMKSYAVHTSIKDALNVAFARNRNCVHFHTLEKGLSEETFRRLKMKLEIV